MFFKDRITVKRTVGDSAQALIFFGRETNIGNRVVLKQYTGETFEEIIREIKVFTELEKDRYITGNQEQQEITEMIKMG